MIVMFRRNLSTGSRNTSLTFRRHRGFTLVEVMMSIVLVAIGTTLAVPSYRSMVEKRQLTHAAEQLTAFINATQSISSRKNQDVVLTYKYVANNQWCIGASTVRAVCDCTQDEACKIDDQLYVLNQDVSGGSALMNSISGNNTLKSFIFDPTRGLFYHFINPGETPPDDRALVTNDPLTMEMRSNNGDFRLNLLMNNSGRVILCSDDSDHAIPGYDVCPLVVVEEAL
jgi:prepilin-type N-terminal cleavage/methylation domain-containing protein